MQPGTEMVRNVAKSDHGPTEFPSTARPATCTPTGSAGRRLESSSCRPRPACEPSRRPRSEFRTRSRSPDWRTCALEPPICSDGRTVESSTLLTGDTRAGLVALSVSPSGPAALEPAAAELADSGATGVPPLHAMVATIATAGRALAKSLIVLYINFSQFGRRRGRRCGVILTCIFITPKTLSAKKWRAAMSAAPI